MWRLSKEAIKPSWNTRVNGSVNPKLLQGVRVFQWRWHHSDKGDMMSVTGHALKKLRLSWNEKKRRAVGRVYPVKTNRSWKCTFKSPGIFDYLCDHKMATAPQRQPHSNWKIAQPLARFSPRRDVLVWCDMGLHGNWGIFRMNPNETFSGKNDEQTLFFFAVTCGN